MCKTNNDLKTNDLEKIIQTIAKAYDVPAIAVSVFTSDEVIYENVYGLRAFGTNDHILLSDYFHIGSISKSILSVIAIEAVENKCLKWDTRFFDVFPEMKNDAKKDYYNVTFKDLLTHRGGVKPYTSGDEVFPDISQSKDEDYDFVKSLWTLEPCSIKKDHAFEWVYSNASIAAAYLMLREVLNLTYEEMLNKIVEPLMGIKPVLGWPYENGIRNFGHYKNDDQTFIIIDESIDYHLNKSIRTAGDLSMTIRDLTTYGQFLLKSHIEKNRFLYMIDHDMNLYTYDSYNTSVHGADGSTGVFYSRINWIKDYNKGISIIINSGDNSAVEEITQKIFEYLLDL